MRQIRRQDDLHFHLVDGFFHILLYDNVEIKTTHQMKFGGNFILNILNKGFYLQDTKTLIGVLSSDIFPNSTNDMEYEFNAKSIIHQTITSMPSDVLFNYLHFYSETNQIIGTQNTQYRMRNALGL